jgi:hypothetical protein
MSNRDHLISLAACGEDVPGVMGTNTRQREALDWTSSLAPPIREGPKRSPGSLPLPRARRQRPVPVRQHLSLEWDGMRERTCF